MDAAQIRAIMEEGRFSDYGIRGLCFDEEYAVGDSPRESYDWDHENDISTYATDGRTLGAARVECGILMRDILCDCDDGEVLHYGRIEVE